MTRMQKIVTAIMDHAEEHESFYKRLFFPFLRTCLLCILLCASIATLLKIVSDAVQKYL